MFLKRLRHLLKARSESIKKLAIALFILSVLLLGCFSAQISQLDGLNGAIDPATLLEVQRLDQLEQLNVNKNMFICNICLYSTSFDILSNFFAVYL